MGYDITTRKPAGSLGKALLGQVFLLIVLSVGLGCASGGSDAPAPPVPASSTEVTQPAEIRSLDLREQGDVAFLEVIADRALVWTNYRDSHGNLVVELPNSVPAQAVQGLARDSGLVTSVEIEQLDDAERPLTRLVVRTSEDSEHSLTTEGEILRLQLLPAGYEEPVELAFQGTPRGTDARPATTASQAGLGTPDAPVSGPPASGAVASRLYAVDARQSGAATIVQVSGDGEFNYSMFRLPDPPRFVVDLTGVINTSSASSIEVDSDLVGRIRVGQFKPRPDPVSRVVFDLNTDSIPQIQRSADGLTITFGEGAPETTLAQEMGADPEPTQMADAGMGDTGMADTGMADTGIAEEPMDDTDMGDAGMGDTGMGDTGMDDEPAMADADLGDSNEGDAVGDESTFTGDPVAAEPEEFVVSDIEEGEPAAPEDAPPAPLFEPTEDPILDDPSTTPVAELEPVDVAPQEPAPVYEAPPPYQPPPPYEPPPYQPQPTDVASYEGQAVDIETNYEDEEPLVPSFDAVFVNRREREYVGEPINMSLKNADLVETLRTFAAISGLNFVIQPGVGGAVTVELKGVPWDQAMEQILRINNLGMEIDNSIVRIAPQEMLRAEAQAEAEIARQRARSVRLRTVMKSLSYASANEVSTLLSNRTGRLLSERGTVQIDARTNSLIISDTPGQIDTILAVIEQLDAPVPQVTVEARVIEATKAFSRSLGIEWGFDGVANQANGNTTGLQFPNNGTADGGVGLLTGGATGFLNLSMGNILNTFNLEGRLQVAENEGLINVVSAPRITTLNNNSASIQSGIQIPLQTVSNRTVSVQYINATLQLTVQPQVTAEGTIIMDLNVAKRSPQFGFTIVGSTNAPIATREAQTTVIVRDGGTIVIGGIYEVSHNEAQDRVPGLANIPVVGHLFKNRNRQNDNNELMIFVTPRIVQM